MLCDGLSYSGIGWAKNLRAQEFSHKTVIRLGDRFPRKLAIVDRMFRTENSVNPISKLTDTFVFHIAFHTDINMLLCKHVPRSQNFLLPRSVTMQSKIQQSIRHLPSRPSRN